MFHLKLNFQTSSVDGLVLIINCSIIFALVQAEFMIVFGTDFQMSLIVTFDVHIDLNRLDFYSSVRRAINTK